MRYINERDFHTIELCLITLNRRNKGHFKRIFIVLFKAGGRPVAVACFAKGNSCW